jgi:hypothetical protein
MRLKTAFRIFPKLWGADGYLRSAGYIFLVGHMRSYSSLLGHILGSHRQIAGYAEMHQKYRDVLDFLELAEKVENSGSKTTAGRYVFDKILHRQDLHSRILRREDVKIVLLARRPEATLASILKIRAGGIASVEQAIDYYVDRLHTLVQISKLRRGRLLYLDSEAVLQRTDETLDRVTRYLAISPRLCAEYSIFRYTGMPKYGDPSERIKAGRVIRQREASPHVPLTSTQLRRLSNAYDSLRRHVMQNAEATVCCDASHTTDNANDLRVTHSIA